MEPGRPAAAKNSIRAFLFAALAAILICGANAHGDELPGPLSGHPGNVFCAGERVTARIEPEVPSSAVRWRLLDDSGSELRAGTLEDAHRSGASPIDLGEQGVGWYRIELLDRDGRRVLWTTAAVLTRLRAPTPASSPICVDTASAWFARDDAEEQRRFASLAALAGIGWVRDRMRWGDVQTGPKSFVEKTTYDSSATALANAGLDVLQVFHMTPEWATDKSLDGARRRGRFPRDLRHIHEFCKAMGERYRGRIGAWEPWNEANVDTFGGHTVDEMCSLQKAAYLGFKAADPEVIVGWNAYTGSPTQRHTRGLIANEAWPYFDTYNIHTYDWPHSYESLWEPSRAAACGRPIWVTESDRGIYYETEGPWYDLSPTDELRKAEFMAPSYASSLLAGASRHFHFILGHYIETNNKVQFGLLRQDLTPRPSYVALAALGRLLAGAKPLGRWRPGGETGDTQVCAFRAWPDGIERDVLVAWAEKRVDWPARGVTRVEWTLPASVQVDEVHDYLGRSLGKRVPAQLGPSAVFVLLPRGEAKKLPLEAPAAASARRSGEPSDVVLQLEMPSSTTREIDGPRWSHGYEHTIEAGKETTLHIVAYNFGSQRVAGELVLEAQPAGWRIDLDRRRLELAPMERSRWGIRVRPGSSPVEEADAWIRMRAELGGAGRPVLAFRLAVR